MATDRIIRFTREHRRPTLKVIGMFLEDYIGAAGTVKWCRETRRFYITFLGAPSHAFRRCDIRGDEFAQQYHEWLAHELWDEPRERWIEVWSDRAVIYVMTRHQDQFVNGIARELTRQFAHRWQGKTIED